MIPRELRDAEDIFLCATLRCAAGFISRGFQLSADDEPKEEQEQNKLSRGSPLLLNKRKGCRTKAFATVMKIRQ